MIKQIAPVALLLVVVVGGYVVYKNYSPAPSEVPVNITTFSCQQGKTIGATFYKTKVDLILSDGRKMTLLQAISASGARYANADGSFVFWNKGNTAFVSEGKSEPQAESYTGCVTPGNTSQPETMQTYSYPPLGFSVKYPAGYMLDESYTYDQLGPEAIPGIKVSVPQKLTDETNLSKDSGVSIEYFPNVPSCTASLFLYGQPQASVMNDGGTTYSTASVSGAGAGNLYEERIYALAGQNPCIAVRYFIHYTQLANYPEGTKKEFKKDELIAQFDTIRRSLTLKNQTPTE